MGMRHDEDGCGFRKQEGSHQWVLVKSSFGYFLLLHCLIVVSMKGARLLPSASKEYGTSLRSHLRLC